MQFFFFHSLMALRRSHFQCGKCEGRRSQSSEARTPSLALPPRWARKEFFVVVCAALLTFVCMLRYSEWNVVPIWFLYSSVLMVVRWADLRSVPCILRYLWWYAVPIWSLYSSIFMVIHWADLVPVFFDTYRNILYQSDISGQDAQSASIPRMFFPVGWKRQPEEGGIGPGCCGGGVITTWAAGDGVIAAGSAVWAAGEFWPCRNAFSRLTEP